MELDEQKAIFFMFLQTNKPFLQKVAYMGEDAILSYTPGERTLYMKDVQTSCWGWAYWVTGLLGLQQM